MHPTHGWLRARDTKSESQRGKSYLSASGSRDDRVVSNTSEHKRILNNKEELLTTVRPEGHISHLQLDASQHTPTMANKKGGNKGAAEKGPKGKGANEKGGAKGAAEKGPKGKGNKGGAKAGAEKGKGKGGKGK